MEPVVSKVKTVQGAGTWESPFGLLYSFEYQMEDGAVFKANHKSDRPFAPGEDVEYNITNENEYGKLGKVSKYKNVAYNGTQSYAKSKGGNSSFALSYAKDLFVPKANAYTDPNELVDEILVVAERFNAWLNNN